MKGEFYELTGELLGNLLLIQIDEAPEPAMRVLAHRCLFKNDMSLKGWLVILTPEMTERLTPITDIEVMRKYALNGIEGVTA